ncbi:unnamed protein product [Paramecium octaurelia]|uniref:Uncharacterized protein n=1 Tax=Paramecium octaurelia TaxID=43137 RepID=A0A8S1VLB4_PAROT|nr:unnamed protein product [Paramecium octaurelia]
MHDFKASLPIQNIIADSVYMIAGNTSFSWLHRTQLPMFLKFHKNLLDSKILPQVLLNILVSFTIFTCIHRIWPGALILECQYPAYQNEFLVNCQSFESINEDYTNLFIWAPYKLSHFSSSSENHCYDHSLKSDNIIQFLHFLVHQLRKRVMQYKLYLFLEDVNNFNLMNLPQTQQKSKGS